MIPHREQARSIPGSERTVLVRLHNPGKEWITTPLDPNPAEPGFAKNDLLAADEVLSGLTVHWMHDSRGIREGAVLDGEMPTACAALFAPGLLPMFEDSFGPEFYVAVPSRFRLYVFPKLASNPGIFAPSVLSDYRAAVYPVSPELFEVGPNGIRAVGILDDR